MRRLITGGILTLAALALFAVIVPIVGAFRDDDPPMSRTSAAPGLTGISDDGGQPQPPAQEGKAPFVGIAIETLSPEEAGDLGIDGGVRVRRVLDDGPAGGILEAGDIITSIGGQPVTTAAEVIETVHAHEIGDVLTLTVRRGEDTLELQVTVGERDAPPRRHTVRSQIRGHHPAKRPGGLLSHFVTFEATVETEDGFKTYRGARGSASDIDVGAGTFVLTPKDGSGPISYEISSTTKVVIGHQGDLGGLDTEQEVLVIDVDGLVKLVVQRDRLAGHSLLGPLFGGTSFPGGPRIRGRVVTRGLPKLGERLRERFRDFPGGGPGRFDFTGPGLQGLPPEIRELLSDLPFDLNDLKELRELAPGATVQ